MNDRKANTQVLIKDSQLAKYNKIFKKSTLMDDLKFRMVCESKGAIEEILRVILNDNKIAITNIVPRNNGVVNGFCHFLLMIVANINITIVMAAPK